MDYLFLITVLQRVQTSEQQSYQTTQRLKKSMKRLNQKNTKVETLPESSTGVWISVLLQVVFTTWGIRVLTLYKCL